MDETMKENRNGLILLAGGLIGLLAGLAAAYLLIKKQEDTGQSIKITTGDGLKIGMGAVSLIKLASDIAVKPR